MGHLFKWDSHKLWYISNKNSFKPGKKYNCVSALIILKYDSVFLQSN